jgi:hypothetical protein
MAAGMHVGAWITCFPADGRVRGLENSNARGRVIDIVVRTRNVGGRSQNPPMKILTATAAGQGARDNDFDWTIEGELVWIGLVCATDRRNPDGGCGCGRSFSGLSSHRATTTAQVRDLPLTRDDVTKALAGYCEAAGYGVVEPVELAEEVDELLRVVSEWDVGTIVERRLDRLQPRCLR